MSDQKYLAGEAYWRYLGIDEKPPLGTKLSLLTKGGVQTQGEWREDCGLIAWSPLIRRDKDKERLMGITI